jgi:hypothetical protein
MVFVELHPHEDGFYKWESSPARTTNSQRADLDFTNSHVTVLSFVVCFVLCDGRYEAKICRYTQEGELLKLRPLSRRLELTSLIHPDSELHKQGIQRGSRTSKPSHKNPWSNPRKCKRRRSLMRMRV